jgi:magnesium chelatase family protein
MPQLRKGDAVDVTKVYSLGGRLPVQTGLITRPPFRMPHHSSSVEGVIGGGREIQPGEISFAHKGVLLLDEAPEFKTNLLQALREPLEAKKISVARAGNHYWFPADFQLIMTANPCPCGNLGRDNSVCLCSSREIHQYWKKMGSALLDRIDIRVPVKPVSAEELLKGPGEKSEKIRRRIQLAWSIQEDRYASHPFRRNSALTPGMVLEYCGIDKATRQPFQKAVKKLYLSSRACHSILKIARTIADLSGENAISSTHLFEAIQHRRFGENDYFWNPL